jgi:hypothetical protein
VGVEEEGRRTQDSCFQGGSESIADCAGDEGACEDSG